jgi:hypothetical protein
MLTTKKSADFQFDGEWLVYSDGIHVATIFRDMTAGFARWYDINACGPTDFGLGYTKAEALAKIASRLSA